MVVHKCVCVCLSSIRVMQRGVFTWRALLAVRTLARSEAKLRALQKERRRLVREVRRIVEEFGPKYAPHSDPSRLNL